LRPSPPARRPAGRRRTEYVMLSEAKHLQYPLENYQMQILRFAQDDINEGFSAGC